MFVHKALTATDLLKYSSLEVKGKIESRERVVRGIRGKWAVIVKALTCSLYFGVVPRICLFYW